MLSCWALKCHRPTNRERGAVIERQPHLIVRLSPPYRKQTSTVSGFTVGIMQGEGGVAHLFTRIEGRLARQLGERLCGRCHNREGREDYGGGKF